MVNGVASGNVLEYTAPAGGVESGQAVLIGSLLVVAAGDAAEAAKFEGVAKGIFTLPRVDSEDWTEGLKLYWDDSAGKITMDDDSAGNPLVGVAVEAVDASPAQATGKVRLDGVAR